MIIILHEFVIQKYTCGTMSPGRTYERTVSIRTHHIHKNAP